MFKKKYHKSSSVLLILFLLSLLLVVAAIIYAYTMGVRYIKTTSNIKFFGFVNKNNNSEILNGKFWLEDGTTVKVDPQGYYIVEVKNVAAEHIDAVTSGLYKLAEAPGDYVLEKINDAIPPEFTETYPMNHFVFNNTDAGVTFYKGRIAALLKEYDAKGNPPVSGEFYTTDTNLWILNSTKSSIHSYKDFDIVWENDKARRYNGDISAFISKEKIVFAAITLKDNNLIYIYPADNIYRFEYEKGNNKGDLYIGEIKNNFHKNGKGIYYYIDTGNICYGNFESDKKTGKFKILYSGGDSYDGDLDDGKKTGQGIFKWANGSSYDGQFKDDMKDGRGINIFADGSVYEGDYVEDAKHGTGKYTFASGDVYSGAFVNDVFSGHGTYTWASGESYEGNFEKNAIHGEGTFCWTTGRKYSGLFENGKMVRE